MPFRNYLGAACLASSAAGCALIAYLRKKASPQRVFPSPAGPYQKLAATFAEINLDQFGWYGKLQVQLLAPHSVGATAVKAKSVEYWRASALKAIPFGFIPYSLPAAREKSLQAGVWQVVAWLIYGILQTTIGWQKHPDSEVGNYEPPEANGEKKLPLVVFSHGLMGSMHMYTQICRELASYGCVVVALEYRDGSATGTTDIPLVPPHKGVANKDRDTVRSFREPFLQHRASELTSLVRYIRETPSAQLHPILRAADPSSMILVGHSLGAAGVVRAVKSSILLRDATKMVILYDTWARPLLDDDVVPDTFPTTCILSQQWYKKKDATEIALSEVAHTLGHRSELWWLPGTAHQFWSDMVWFLPASLKFATLDPDPKPAHAAMLAKTYAALDKCLGKATPQPKYPSSAIIELQLPLQADEPKASVST